MPGLELLEDEIGRKLREAETNGELQSAHGYGKPLKEPEGWYETPDELRKPFKILKDAGIVPPEVELMKQRAQLREQIASCKKPSAAEALREQLSALELSVSLRLEATRSIR